MSKKSSMKWTLKQVYHLVNRRTVNMQIDYRTRTCDWLPRKGSQSSATIGSETISLYIRCEKSFYISINVNDYVEHRAEVLQSYAQNWLTSWKSAVASR